MISWPINDLKLNTSLILCPKIMRPSQCTPPLQGLSNCTKHIQQMPWLLRPQHETNKQTKLNSPINVGHNKLLDPTFNLQHKLAWITLIVFYKIKVGDHHRRLSILSQKLPCVMLTFAKIYLHPTWKLHYGTWKGDIRSCLRYLILCYFCFVTIIQCVGREVLRFSFHVGHSPIGFQQKCRFHHEPTLREKPIVLDPQ